MKRVISRLQKQGEQQAQQRAKEQGAAQQQATAEQLGNFRKASSVCLEAKDYMVRFQVAWEGRRRRVLSRDGFSVTVLGICTDSDI